LKESSGKILRTCVPDASPRRCTRGIEVGSFYCSFHCESLQVAHPERGRLRRVGNASITSGLLVSPLLCRFRCSAERTTRLTPPEFYGGRPKRVPTPSLSALYKRVESFTIRIIGRPGFAYQFYDCFLSALVRGKNPESAPLPALVKSSRPRPIKINLALPESVETNVPSPVNSRLPRPSESASLPDFYRRTGRPEALEVQLPSIFCPSKRQRYQRFCRSPGAPMRIAHLFFACPLSQSSGPLLRARYGSPLPTTSERCAGGIFLVQSEWDAWLEVRASFFFPLLQPRASCGRNAQFPATEIASLPSIQNGIQSINATQQRGLSTQPQRKKCSGRIEPLRSSADFVHRPDWCAF
jgi:hypothetical protein